MADARLQLYAVAANLPGTQAVALVTNDAWDEPVLTWTTRVPSGPPLATWQPEVGTAVQVPLLPTVQQEMAGDGLLSLRLFATNSTTDGRVDYASREAAAALAPKLILTSSNAASAALSATQSFWVSVQVPACPVLSAESITGGQFRLTVNGDAGPDYIVLASSNLSDWTALFTTNAAPMPFSWQDTDTSAPRRFYRVILGP